MAYEQQPPDMQAKIIELFHQSIEAKMACGELIALDISYASEVLVASLLSEGRVFCCGNGTSASLAGILVQKLALQYKMDRPSFAAFLLGADLPFATASLQNRSANELFSHQLDGLGSEQDILIVFSHGDAPSNIVRVIQSAHAKGMRVIAFSSSGDNNINASLSDQDCQIFIENPDQHRVTEIQLLAIFALCELVDYQIFGGVV